MAGKFACDSGKQSFVTHVYRRVRVRALLPFLYRTPKSGRLLVLAFWCLNYLAAYEQVCGLRL